MFRYRYCYIAVSTSFTRKEKDSGKRIEKCREERYASIISRYLHFPLCSLIIVTSKSHIRNPTFAATNGRERPINHRDTRINVSYRPHPGNAIIWKLMAGGLPDPPPSDVYAWRIAYTKGFHPRHARAREGYVEKRTGIHQSRTAHCEFGCHPRVKMTDGNRSETR